MNRRRAPIDPNVVPVPEVLKPSVAKAKARTQGRRHGPPIHLHRNEDGSTEWRWPFGETEGELADWRWLVLDAFGTRNDAVAAVFLQSLLDLCTEKFDEPTQEWVPCEGEMVMILHIVSAHKPRNEAEASLAAQIAATHLITMTVAKRVMQYPWDTRMVGAYAKLIRANGALVETMATIKGKRRSTTQKINVVHEKHVHQHQHVHIAEGGVPAHDHQPQAAELRTGRKTRARAIPASARQAPQLPSLPCQDEAGHAMLVAGGDG